MSKKFLTVVLVVLFANCAFSQSLEIPKQEFNKTDLTNQFLSQNSIKDSTEKKVEVSSSPGKKSGGIALILSLLLPGAGHFYIDRMDVGKYFLGAEAMSWLGYAGLQVYGDALQDDSRTFAAENAGVNKDGKDKDYFANIGNYNNIYEYNNYMLATGRYDEVYDVTTNYWNWNTTVNKDDFESQRKKSERVYNTRVVFGTTAIINRIVSSISALILTNKKSPTTLNFQPELIQKEYGGGVDGMKLNISKNF